MHWTVGSAPTLMVKVPELAPLVPLPLLTPWLLAAWKLNVCGVVSPGAGVSASAHSVMYCSVVPEPEVVVVAPEPTPQEVWLAPPKVALEVPKLRLPEVMDVVG